jgi:hypothetical protein
MLLDGISFIKLFQMDLKMLDFVKDIAVICNDGSDFAIEPQSSIDKYQS